jgi:hypothetical protein
MLKNRPMKQEKSPDKNIRYDFELKENRYARIPKNFIEKIELDNDRNIILKSNNNVWFFKIHDINEENEIAEEVKVNVDKKWGFTVPLMYFQKEQKSCVKNFVFFDDENGTGCGHAASYFSWAMGKLNKERIKSLELKSMEEVDDHIREVLKKNREEK